MTNSGPHSDPNLEPGPGPGPNPGYMILYVDNAVTSAGFYAGLLGKAPVEASPGFALFVLESGSKLGLWSRHTVEPAASATGGEAELAFPVADTDTVHSIHSQWVARGLDILQAPTAMDFGFTFVASDPDGHRLRVFARPESRVEA